MATYVSGISSSVPNGCMRIKQYIHGNVTFIYKFTKIMTDVIVQI